MIILPDPANFPVLETERLLLRKIRPADEEALFQMRRDRDIMRFIPRPVAQTMADVQRLLEMVEKGGQEKTSINWAITIRGNDTLVGTIGFVRMKPEDFRAEVGYMMTKAAQGKGFMQEALKKVIGYGFDHMQLHTIEGVIDPGNIASEKVLMGCGFVKEGYFRENVFYEGKFMDSAYYTKFRS